MARRCAPDGIGESRAPGSTSSDAPVSFASGQGVTSVDWPNLLMDPGAYPDLTRQVRCIETHISWVFLTDRFAYKVKKPVAFEFLDFSTLEKRLAACRAEVQLNQRLAPDVYCGVVPICLDRRGNPHVDGKGPPDEWAVKMRRLPEDRSLEFLLRTRCLADADVTRVARALAGFYHRLPPVPLATEDYRRRLEHHVVANRLELLRPSHGLEAAPVYRVHTAQLAILRLAADLLDNRARDGRIVEGHGDLRPEHIYLTSQPLIIDCIEFSREFREVDVVDELCFLAMECDRAGATDIGEKLLRQYTQTTGDRPADELVRFYKSYRASVRAKVMALRVDQLRGPSRSAARGDARDYLRLADRYAEGLLPPLVVIVCGVSGSGKSTFAEQLGEQLGIEVFRSDAIRRARLGDAAPVAWNEGPYSLERRDAVYREMLASAEQRLALGISVILDATFLRTLWRAEAIALARRWRARPFVVHCQCPADVAAQRIAVRGDTDSDAWPALVSHQLAAFEEDPPATPACSIDTVECLPLQMQTLFRHLGQYVFPGTGTAKGRALHRDS